jgi:hypothetical protein
MVIMVLEIMCSSIRTICLNGIVFENQDLCRAMFVTNEMKDGILYAQVRVKQMRKVTSS